MNEKLKDNIKENLVIATIIVGSYLIVEYIDETYMRVDNILNSNYTIGE